MFGIIYRIVNKINGKSYIGQTSGSMQKRWNRHVNEGGCPFFHKSIQKYGKANFEVKVLAHCNNMEEMNHRERYYIKLFNTLAPNGYNLTAGGQLIGPGNPFFGRKHSNKTKQKLSAKSNGWLGKKHSESTKRKMSAWQKGVPKTNLGAIKKSAETRKKRFQDKNILTLSRKTQKTRKSVKCHQNGIIYDSIRHAAKELNLPSKSKISDVLNGKYRQYLGYTFEGVCNDL